MVRRLGVDSTLFCDTYPRLFHMAHKDALPGILKHGLLSTSALLDLFEITGDRREKIETRMRPEGVVIEHPDHGQAVIRDQKPIGSDDRLTAALGGTATAAEWHLLLNSKVFFWVIPDRLEILRKARAYRDSAQLVLVLDTERVVRAAAERVWLCSMNSGACLPFAHSRSPDKFRRLADYDFDYWRRRRNVRSAVVECAIDRELQSVNSFLISAEVVA